jgi:autotransporter-associated beta strand protein
VTVNAAAVPALISGNLGLPTGYREFRVADGSALMDLQINANVLGPGTLYKTGPGQMWLNSANTYSGVTLIGEGTLVANAIGALGSTASGTVVLDGATLAFNFLNSTIGELISLRGAGVAGTSGALNIQGTATLRSPFPSIYACLDLTTNATIRVESGGQLTADGFISGTGPLIKTGAGTLLFTSGYGNTYSGDTAVRQGTLTLQKPAGVTAIPGHVSVGSGPGGPASTLLQQSSFSIIGQVTVNGGGLWSLTGQAEGFSSTVPPPLTLNDGGSVQSGSAGIFYLPPGGDVVVNPGASTSTIGGNIGLDAGLHHIAVGNGGGNGGISPGLLITAAIGQTGADAAFQKDGPGFMRFNGVNSCTGTSIIAGGRFQMNGSQSSGAVQVNAGAKLDGLGGGTWRILMNGGTVAPGPMPGVLGSGNFNENGGSGTLQFELDSTTPGLANSKLNAYGSVNLAGLNLSLILNFVPPTNSQFIIVENTSANPTTGNFSGLPQNGIFSMGGRVFRINYAGNTGNDVVLTDIGGLFQPMLTIERPLPNSVRLLWPTNDPSLGLQFNTNLPTAGWQPVSGTPAILGTNYVVTNTITGARRFFRLSKP